MTGGKYDGNARLYGGEPNNGVKHVELLYTFVRTLSPGDVAIARSRALEQSGCCQAVVTADKPGKGEVCNERD